MRRSFALLAAAAMLLPSALAAQHADSTRLTLQRIFASGPDRRSRQRRFRAL